LDFLGRNQTIGSSFIGHHSLQSISVLIRDPFRGSTHQLFVAQSGANPRGGERIFGGFNHTSDDVFKKYVGQGNLCVRERLKSLHLLRHIRKRGGHARLKLLGRLGVSVLPNLVLASGNEECLLGTKAAFFDSGANLIPQLGGRVSKIAGQALFIHKTLLSRAVPQRHHYLLEVVPSKA
jgi:hypothetical protein